MTPKEKARELVNKFIGYSYFSDGNNSMNIQYQQEDNAKQCALIAVEEMLEEYQSMSDLESIIVINDEVRFIVHQLQYWMLVKQQINLL
jgi:hypothetical protein